MDYMSILGCQIYHPEIRFVEKHNFLYEAVVYNLISAINEYRRLCNI